MVVETVPFGTQVYQIHVADSLRKEKRRKGPPGNWEETGLDGIVDRIERGVPDHIDVGPARYLELAGKVVLDGAA
ncbi:hypothetical protein FB004_103120 [Sinorhizobium medicae]|nr:hypothetical protein FB004_103120 [Sinorhizobium medicae]